jgi:hypothetical protein
MRSQPRHRLWRDIANHPNIASLANQKHLLRIGAKCAIFTVLDDINRSPISALLHELFRVRVEGAKGFNVLVDCLHEHT